MHRTVSPERIEKVLDYLVSALVLPYHVPSDLAVKERGLVQGRESEIVRHLLAGDIDLAVVQIATEDNAVVIRVGYH